MKVEIPISLYALLQQHNTSQQQSLQPNKFPTAFSNISAPTSKLSSVDQSNSRLCFVERLVDTSSSVIESIWPSEFKGSSKALSLRSFIQEILRRSKTSFSTLQLALLYIVRVHNRLNSDESHPQHLDVFSFSSSANVLPQSPICGRRMFLAALISASKYLQDRNYSNKAWSKISGLPVSEINAKEMEFLALIDFELYVGHETFANWTTLLMAKMQQLQIAQQLQHSHQLQGQVKLPAIPLMQQSSSLEGACVQRGRSVKVVDSRMSSLDTLASVAVSMKNYSDSPVSVSPSLADYPSPESDDAVPGDCLLKRGRSFCHEDESVVKRVCAE